MKSKIFAAFFGLFVFLLPFNAYALPLTDGSGLKNSAFSDVALDDENFKAIYFLKNTDVINGYESGDAGVFEYKPEKSVNRAEFLKIIYEGSDLAREKEYGECFPDVPADAWFNTYVCQAKAEGVIEGYDDGFFRPEKTINQAEAVKILSEVVGIQKAKIEKADPWYKAYLLPADEMEIVEKLDADSLMTRGDIAEMIYRNRQIETLKIESYQPEYDDELFAIEDIPLDGVLSPGGLLGPFGAFGGAGAFTDVDDGLLANDEIELLDEDFYTDNYCYFSDQGQYSGEALAFLQKFTSADFDKYIEGSDIDDFGKMFCYEGAAQTDLVYFSKELRNEYDVICWQDPKLLTFSEEGVKEILCYVDSSPSSVEFAHYAEVYVDEMNKVEVDFDEQMVEVMQFRVGSIGSDAIELAGVKLHSLLNAPYTAIDRLTLKDEDGEVMYDERIYMFNWRKDALNLQFAAPVAIAPGNAKIFKLYADFDWEDNAGEVMLGFNSAKDFLTESIVDLGVNKQGAMMVLEKAMEVVQEAFPLCLTNQKGSAGANAGGQIVTETATLDENSHDVLPVVRRGDVCMSNAVYSSLRWMEKFFGRDDLIPNGDAGVDYIIPYLNPSGLFVGFTGWLGQLHDLVKLIEDSPAMKQCLTVDWNSTYGPNVQCNELKANFDQQCDIPLGITCVSKASKNKWGHTVDIVDIEIDEENSNKCKITFANSWDAEEGQLAAPDSDGFSGGTYEVGYYDYSKNSFDVKTIWGNAFTCEVNSAAYICPNYDIECLPAGESIDDYIDIDFGDEDEEEE